MAGGRFGRAQSGLQPARTSAHVIFPSDCAFLRAVVVSPKAVVEIVREFHNHANLTALKRQELIERVFRVATVSPPGQMAVEISRATLVVVLKLLGTHAEPQHITYLLQVPTPVRGSQLPSKALCLAQHVQKAAAR